jgi:serine/threonine protein kinase
MPSWQVSDWIEDRYEVFDIHTGGMGVVYVVYDHQGQAGQRVQALKTLKLQYLSESRPIARFVGECRTWIQLDRHPNIVRAYTVQLIGGQPFVFLELVTGGSLRSWIGSARLDLPQVLRFGVQFCLGMEHAARKGLQCHRDVKPENLLITEGGTLKITDFGLAKITDWVSPYGSTGDPIPLAEENYSARIMPGEEEPDWVEPEPEPDPGLGMTPALDLVEMSDETTDWRPDVLPAPVADEATIPLAEPGIGATADIAAAPVDRGATADGALLGTGIYMAPEQFRDPKGVNLLADMYSFGVVLYEMIATRPPFRSSGATRLARMHAQEPPPSLVRYVPSRYGRVARRIENIVFRCLAKEPLRRFRNFAELRLALAAILHRLTGEVPVVPSEVELEAWDLNSKGVSLATLGRFEEEQQTYEMSLRTKPNYVPTWFNQAAAAGVQGHLVEALQYADLALHLNARSVPALINKGLALYALRRPAEAIACFNEASHLAPRDPDAWRGRAVVLLGMDNREGARLALNVVRRLRPGQPPLSPAPGPLPGPGAPPRPETLPWVRRTEDTSH